MVGLVRDVYTQGLWREIEPMMIKYVLPANYSQLVVSANAAAIPSVNEFMRAEWSKLFPNRLYNGNMLATLLEEVNNVNLNIIYMYAFLGAVAMMLSVTGLFTLVSLNIIKRMKEIGVRKILGASVSNIARVINLEFFIILLLASGIGSWVGYTMCNLLMGSIWKYYQGVNVVTFVSSVSVLLVISLFTVGYKIYNVGSMNPVNSLKDE